jgi:hypothetical protein
MEKINTILDRKPINSEYINSKQDFNKVMNGFQKLKPPVYKQAWFYGAVGLAAVAIVFTAVSLTSTDDDKEIIASADVKKEVPLEQEPSEKTAVLVADLNHQEQGVPEAEPVLPKSTIVKPAPIAEKPPTVEKRVVEAPPVVPETPKIAQPHIAGVFGGAIAFADFCDPVGIQVNKDVAIVEYTIHYMSCTQDVTFKMRGGKIPQGVCNELRNCGEQIEIDFRNVKGYNKKTGKAVEFGDFSVVPIL